MRCRSNRGQRIANRSTISYVEGDERRFVGDATTHRDDRSIREPGPYFQRRYVAHPTRKGFSP
jgi:hypothetical protein